MAADLGGSLAGWALLVACLACLPFAVRWLVRRRAWGPMAPDAARILASLPLGPQQKVVTLEMGPKDARFQLVLGVTPQSVTCLHKMASHPEERMYAPD
ncbi:MAG: FliO/MopB family protein [Polaromonas sp.]|jgi:flagellar protein FliO/FliZ